MEKQSKVKSRRKLIEPLFHVQSKDEDDQHLTNDLIKLVKKTGQLKLSGQHLSSVPTKMFLMYESTDENAINVDFNSSSKDDEAWWNIKPLTHLDLSSNVLTDLPSQISMFQDLLVLNLQDNNLTALPAEIGDLTKLIKLNLNRNKINVLPKNFFRLTELRSLNLSNNNLDNIPKGLSDLVMLEALDLSNNNISKLPSGIGFLVRLTELNISNNKLNQLPPDIVNLRNLTKLELNHNNIETFPMMGELRKLQFFYAQHNDIKEIPSFLGCENVQEIYLGNNFIKEIPQDFFDTMPHLKILEFRDNQIETIPQNVLKVPHLTKFDITNNELTELPACLALLPHLQTLKVESNKLKQIRADIIRTGTQRILNHLREKLTAEDMQSLGSASESCGYDVSIFPDRYTMKNGNILNLAMKNLSDIPDEVFSEAKEAHVMTVDLCKNKFTYVPSGLKIIANNITELNLSVNQLKELPSYIEECKKLKYLDLGKNLLSSLPDSLGTLAYLRELALCSNRFSIIPSCIYNMVGLEILLINDNSITEINVDGLKCLKRLATLNLSNNSISHVPPELGSMTQLRALELRGNSFKQPRYTILEQGTESILSYLRDKIPR